MDPQGPGRLDEHGTTWSGEAEALRRTRITRLLRTTDLTIDAIAARTGYADARALRRAVRRWCGNTPDALRRAGRGPGAPGARPGLCHRPPGPGPEPGG
ncbi:hypothetical protein GCM10009639_57970 [Kitasatospora putterlickiae]|uniref:HTH araC/xylS-type domain-containing protein n=1 Tax=Kitasatospora putterlickiae TaxID=221725 RepID=A0ABN1YES9_9ACTN